MKTLLIDNGTKHLGKLKELLFPNDISVYPLFRRYPDLIGFDLVVLSGGSQFSIANAPEIFKEEIGLIKNSHKPIIGICEGCEMIAYAFGSELQFNEKVSHGPKKITPIGKLPLFKNLKTIEVYEAHHWAITKLGKELVGLAKSKTGYEIIKHKNKTIYGLQFHPEMLTDKVLGDEIFIGILSKIKGETYPEIE